MLVQQLSGDLLCQLQVDEDCTIELLKLARVELLFRA